MDGAVHKPPGGGVARHRQRRQPLPLGAPPRQKKVVCDIGMVGPMAVGCGLRTAPANHVAAFAIAGRHDGFADRLWERWPAPPAGFGVYPNRILSNPAASVRAPTIPAEHPQRTDCGIAERQMGGVRVMERLRQTVRVSDPAHRRGLRADRVRRSSRRHGRMKPRDGGGGRDPVGAGPKPARDIHDWAVHWARHGVDFLHWIGQRRALGPSGEAGVRGVSSPRG